MLLRSILCGRAWNGFLLGKTKEEDVPCRFCGDVDGDGHLFWDCPSLLLFVLGNMLSFSPLWRLTAAPGPVVLLGMAGYLPSLHEGYSLHGLLLK